MTMLLLASLAPLALAHGGEDHGAPAKATVSVSADAVRVAAASSAFEAVIRIERGAGGAPGTSTLLLSDYVTSAPIEGAAASLTLSGPATVQLDFAAAGSPGVYQATATFPATGEYAGALVVTAPGASDLLAISGVAIADPPAVGSTSGRAVAGVILGLVAVAGVAALAALVGYLAGRGGAAGGGRAKAVAVLVLGVASAIGGREASAHGGEDHGPPATGAAAAPAPGAAGGTGGALSLPMESQFLLGLRTIRVVQDSFQDQVQALGRFVSRPGGSATLRAPVSGVLLAPPGGFPSPGHVVVTGGLLAEVRETPGSADRAALAQQRGEAAIRVAEAKKGLTLAERDALQAEALGDAISERERLDRRLSVKVAQEAVRQAEAALAGVGQGVTVAIRAPLGGRLGSVTARPGDQVEAGSPLFRITDAVGLWVEARVPERLAVGLAPGAAAVVTTGALPGRVLAAVVLDAGQEADPETGTVLVTLSVEADDLGLRPGFGARAWIGRGPTRDALVLPDAAIVDSNGAALAFVKIGPESFETRELSLGGRAGGEVEVLAGIRPGERVVTDGTYALRSLAGR